MPYGAQTEYLKHNSGCDCDSEESCGCGTSDDCGCCPIGTIAIYDDCGKHLSCLTPEDASQYFIDTLDVPEGFVKVIGSGGEYIGLLTVADYNTYLASTGAGLAFVTTGPITITPTVGVPGSFDVVVQSSVNPFNAKVAEPSDSFPFTGAIAGGNAEMNNLTFDRNAFYGDLVITFDSLPAGFTAVVPTITVPANKSRVDTVTTFPTINWTVQTAGTYNMNLIVTPAGLSPVTMVVTIVLT
jgi:hypothetical protein